MHMLLCFRSKGPEAGFRGDCVSKAVQMCLHCFKFMSAANAFVRSNMLVSVCLQMLVLYGQYALQIGTVANAYGEKYKGIWLSLTIMSRALAGNYVNFGVFDLYGDPALKVHSFICPESMCPFIVAVYSKLLYMLLQHSTG